MITLSHTQNKYIKLALIIVLLSIVLDYFLRNKREYILPFKMFNINAISLPPIGIFYFGMPSITTRKHEHIHWLQFWRMGSFTFYLNYLREVLRFGYGGAPMELEAYKQ